MTRPETLATVGALEITGADVARRVQRIRAEAGPESLPAAGSPAERRLRRWVLHALVNEAVVAAEAASRALVDDAAAEPDAGVVAAVFEAVTADVTVADNVVNEYYARNVDRYLRPETRRVRHLVLADRGSADVVAARARSRAPSSQPAAVRSTGSAGAPAGATVEQVSRGQVCGPLEDALFAAAPGDVVGPLRSELGWHVARVEAVTPAATVPLEAVREAIAADLLAAERGRRFDAWLGQRRAELVTVAAGHEHPGDPRAPDSNHRH